MNEPGPMGFPMPSSMSDPKASDAYVPLYEILPYLPITCTLFTCSYLLGIFLSFEDINFKKISHIDALIC